MQTQRWQQLRALFDAVCDLPAERWRDELQRLSDDPELIDEADAVLPAVDRRLQPAEIGDDHFADDGVAIERRVAVAEKEFEPGECGVDRREILCDSG